MSPSRPPTRNEPAPRPRSDETAFTDIHCHLVSGIDDGAPSLEDSLAMARMAVEDGIARILCTPHQLGSYRQNEGRLIRDRVAALQKRLDLEGIDLEILPGADVRIEADLVPLLRAGRVLTLGDRGKHVLLELPHELFMPLDRLLAELKSAGVVGILSHPERNHGILAHPHVVGPLVESGCLMQVTAGSLVGTFGPQVQRFAEELLRQGVVHFLATDAHSSKSRRPLMRRAFERAAELVGREAALDLCCRNPAAVFAGEEVRPSAASRRTRGFFGWRRSA